MAWTGFQWPVLIGKTGLVEWHTMWHYTILLFLTAGFTNESSYSVKGEKFLDNLNVANLHIKVHFLNR
jgi:hypothetical protein